MRTHMKQKLILLPLVGMLCCNVHGANVLLNGNFDDFSILTGAYNSPYDATTNPDGYTDDYGPIRIYQETVTGMGWRTTATDNKIELWQNGAQTIASSDGIQFAEINAFQNAALYQDTVITGGGQVDFSFAHRGRNAPGADVLNVTITYFGLDNAFGTGDDVIAYDSTGTGNFSDGNASWGNYAVNDAFTSVDGGSYRFSFGAISSVGGNSSEGNFLDNVQFGVNVVPEPSSALLGSLGALALLRRRRR